MSSLLNRIQVRSEFEKRCESVEDESESGSISLSVPELVALFNSAMEGDGFEEKEIGDAYVSKGWTEDTALTWCDIEGLLDDIVRASTKVEEISPTIPLASTVEDTWKAKVYQQITERQERNEFPLVQPEELSTMDEKEAALLILSLMVDIDKARLHEYVHDETVKALASDGEPQTTKADDDETAAQPQRETEWIYDMYYVILQRFLLLECLKTRRFLHRWTKDHFVPLIAPQSIVEGDSRKQAAETTKRITEKHISLVDEALWNAWSKIEKMLVTLDADSLETFVRFVDTDYFNILAKTEFETAKRPLSFPPYPYPISESEAELRNSSVFSTRQAKRKN